MNLGSKLFIVDLSQQALTTTTPIETFQANFLFQFRPKSSTERQMDYASVSLPRILRRPLLLWTVSCTLLTRAIVKWRYGFYHFSIFLHEVKNVIQVLSVLNVVFFILGLQFKNQYGNTADISGVSGQFKSEIRMSRQNWTRNVLQTLHWACLLWWTAQNICTGNSEDKSGKNNFEINGANVHVNS